MYISRNKDDNQLQEMTKNKNWIQQEISGRRDKSCEGTYHRKCTKINDGITERPTRADIIGGNTKNRRWVSGLYVFGESNKTNGIEISHYVKNEKSLYH